MACMLAIQLKLDYIIAIIIWSQRNWQKLPMVSFFHTSSLFSSSSLLAQPGLEREVQQGGQPSGLRERRQVPQYLFDTCLKYTLSTVQMSSGVLINLISSSCVVVLI